MSLDPRHVSAPAATGAPLDLEYLRRQTFDDRELEAELLALFARQARRTLEALVSLHRSHEEGRQARADLFHALCGSARAIGAWQVAECAERLERAERDGQGGSMELGALEEAVARTCEAAEASRVA